MKLYKPYQEFADSRGMILGIINSGTWEEINYIETKRGEVRGGHYHKETTELFFIFDGEIEIETSNIAGSTSERCVVRKGDIVVIEPLEVHTFKCLTDACWINVLSRRMNSANPDFHHQ